MRYRSTAGIVEVDGTFAWVRAALLDRAVVRPGLAAGRRLGGRAPDRWARRAVRLLGIDLEVTGLQNVDPAQSYIVVPLHEGMVDPLVIVHLPLRLRFVVRSEIFDWPGVGPYLRATGQVATDPEEGRTGYRRLLAAAHEADWRRESLVVFPQGTVLGIETAFSGGGFRAAAHARLPLLPVVLTGTHRVWEHPFSPRLRFGVRVAMRVLPAVAPGDTVMPELQAEMKHIALSGAMPAPRRFEPDRDGWWDGYAYEIDPAFPDLAARVARHRIAHRV